MMGTEQQQYPYVECALHAEQIEQIGKSLVDIKGDTRDIRADIKTVLPIVAAHAEAIGDLKRRICVVESQMNWAKWLGGLAAAATAVITWMQSRP